MKIIQHRRHSKRQAPHPHLSSEGVTLARKIGEIEVGFDYVLTSSLPRAIETSVAMGFAVNFSSTELGAIMSECDRVLPSMGSLFNIYRECMPGQKLEELANRVLAVQDTALNQIRSGERLLIISHMGVVELTLAATLSQFAPEVSSDSEFEEKFKLNPNQPLMSYCQGYELSLSSSGVTSAKFIL